MQFEFVFEARGLLLNGLLTTLWLTVSTIVLALFFGTLFAVARVSSNAPVRMLATSYSFVFRALPGLTVLFFAYYGTPSFGLYLGAKTAAILGLTLTSTAYTMEIIRAGLRSVPIGQFEATRALGISRWRALQRVILPIAMRVITPPLCSQFVLVLKSSSIASLVAVSELTGEAMGQIATTFRPMEFLLVVGAIYLIISSVISVLQYQLERMFGLK